MKRQIRNRLSTLCTLSAAAATLSAASGCQQDTSGSDPNALYAYLDDKHTFIVSHAFNDSIYANLGADLAVDPSAKENGQVFTCFYEVQLDTNQMAQCATETGVAAYTNPAGTNDISGQGLSERDVWRLMAANPDKVKSMYTSVLPLATLQNSIENDWKPGVDKLAAKVQIQQAASALNQQPAGAYLTDGYNLGFKEILLQQGLPLLLQIIKPKKNEVKTATTSSVACQSLNEVSQDKTKALRSSLLGMAGNTLLNATGLNNNAPIVGLLAGGLGYVNNLIGRKITKKPVQTASDELSAQCSADQAVAATTQTPPSGTSVQSANADTVAKVVAAAKTNDVETVRSLLKAESYRKAEVLAAANVSTSQTLKDAYSPMSPKKLDTIRMNIINASKSVAGRMGGATCMAPSDFAKKVLRRALLEAPTQNDTKEAFEKFSGCAGGSRNVTVEAVEANSSQKPKIPVRVASASEANSQVDETAKELVAEMNTNPPKAEDGTDSYGTETTTPNEDTTTPSSSSSANFSGEAPASCLSNSTWDFNQLSTEELKKRIATCKKPFPASSGSDVFGDFSQALRDKCADKSSNTLNSKATCYCSCRWNAGFHDRLKSEM